MLRPFTPTRCLLFLACLSCLLIFTLVPRYDLLGVSEPHQMAPRALLVPPGPAVGGDSSTSGGESTSSSSTTTAASTSSSTAPSSSAGTSSSSSPSPAQPASPTQPSSTSSSSTASQPSSSSGPSPTPPSSSSPSNGGSSTPPATSTSSSIILSTSVSTNNEGERTTVVVTVPAPPNTSSSTSASTTAGSDQSDGDDGSSKGVGTSTIIGLSVAGGVAFIGIIAFIIWKFTRKRFSDDDFDDGDAIKWPELNTHGENPHALPTQRADNTGFETNSQVNLTRPDSRAGSFATSAAGSAVDLYPPNAAQDPYAVPPLPHLNPNQPYRDDPVGGFYDPYSGPVPQTFGDGDNVSIAGGEAIPMTQINRIRSPAPPMGYDAGRASPGPQMAYDAGRRSPGPQAAYLTDQTGRASPSPRAMSPGPGMALSGRGSPGPQAAYGYGGGAPPGLHSGY